VFTSQSSDLSTRDRLIAAAGAMFARDGFQRAGVREICALAGANIASVKYYFGNKEGLYRQTILQGVQELGAAQAVSTPPADFDAFLNHFLKLTLIRRHNHPYAGRIMKHELREPTAMLDEVVEAVIRPLHRQFARLLAAKLDGSPTSKEVQRLAAFALSFCANLETSRAVLERIGLEFPENERAVEAFAPLVSAFILFGATGSKSPRKGRR